MKYTDLPTENKICAYAWRGAHIKPNGVVTPCCIAKENTGNVVKLTDASLLHKTRDSELWRAVRKDMINGDEHPACDECWKVEARGEYSYRHHGNETCEDNLHDIVFNEDGSLDSTQILTWDVRDTNLCNMKCAMCSPLFSSKLQQEAIQQKDNKNYFLESYVTSNNETPVIVSFMDQNILEELIKNNLSTATKKFYWAGGEPLISKLHFKILQYMTEHNLTHITHNYNTNMLKVDQFGINIVDLWKQFNRIGIGASIDAVGERAEFARPGTDWNKIEDNFKYLFSEFSDNHVSHVGVELNTTVSFYTLGGLPELFRWAESYGGKIASIRITLVQGKHYMTHNILPYNLRKKIVDEIDNMNIQYVKLNGWDFVRAELLNDDELDISHRHTAFRYFNELDKIRGTDILSACPELTDIWER